MDLKAAVGSFSNAAVSFHTQRPIRSLIILIMICSFIPGLALFQYRSIGGPDGGYYAHYLKDLKIQRVTLLDRLTHAPVFFHTVWVVNFFLEDFLAIKLVSLLFVGLLGVAVYLFTRESAAMAFTPSWAVTIVLTSPCLIRMICDIKKQAAGLAVMTFVLWAFSRARRNPTFYYWTVLLLFVGLLTHRSVLLVAPVIMAAVGLRRVLYGVPVRNDLIFVSSGILFLLGGYSLFKDLVDLGALDYVLATDSLSDSWERYGIELAPMLFPLLLFFIPNPHKQQPLATAWSWLGTVFVLGLPQFTATNNWRFQVILFVPLGILCALSLERLTDSRKGAAWILCGLICLIQIGFGIRSILRNPLIRPSLPSGAELQLQALVKPVPVWTHVYTDHVLGFWLSYLTDVHSRSFDSLIHAGGEGGAVSNRDATYLIRYNPALFGCVETAPLGFTVDVVCRVESAGQRGSAFFTVPAVLLGQTELYQFFELPANTEPLMVDGAFIDTIIRRDATQSEEDPHRLDTAREGDGRNWFTSAMRDLGMSVVGEPWDEFWGGGTRSRWWYGSSWFAGLSDLLPQGRSPWLALVRFGISVPLTVFLMLIIFSKGLGSLRGILGRSIVTVLSGLALLFVIVLHVRFFWGPAQRSPAFIIIGGARVERLLEDEQGLKVEQHFRRLHGRPLLNCRKS